MPKGDIMAQKVALSCEKCGARNYHLPATKDNSKRIELKKYCSHCNEHTLHKQTK
ncbi:50S ribosomal protein L33 [Rummeliibacillus sp. NPDC094406]|uniref:50S ribosomal protein L33 n=1 Tax=Rummeliibacillus TaxID=648802 RepID=UPI0037C526A3